MARRADQSLGLAAAPRPPPALALAVALALALAPALGRAERSPAATRSDQDRQLQRKGRIGLGGSRLTQALGMPSVLWMCV